MAFVFSKAKQTLIRSSKELAVAGVSFYGALQVVSYGTDKVLVARKATLESDLKSLVGEEAKFQRVQEYNRQTNQIGVGANMIHLPLAIGCYTGLANLSQSATEGGLLSKLYSGAPLRPPMPRSPLSLPLTIAATVAAFVSAPLVSVAAGVLGSPLQQLQAYTAKQFEAGNNGAAIQRQEAHGEEGSMEDKTAIVSANTGGSLKTPESLGTKHGATMEAAIPGALTLWAPLMEELFYRGMLMQRLIPAVGPTVALLSSSVAFGAMHEGADGLSYMPVKETLLGLWFGLLHMATGGRLLVPFAAHVGNNIFYVIMEAIESCPRVIAQQWLLSQSEVPDSQKPQFNFWERRLANNRGLIAEPMVWFLSTVLVGHGIPKDVPFLPLNFVEACEKEEPSKNSFMFNADTGTIITAPALYNDDGTFTPLAEALIDIQYYCHFNDLANDGKDDYTKLSEYTKMEVEIRALYHVLATRDLEDEVQSTPLSEIFTNLGEIMEEPQLEVARIKRFQDAFGWTLLHYPSGKFSLEEWKKGFENLRRLGLHSEVNEHVFIGYFLYNSMTGKAPGMTMEELIQNYMMEFNTSSEVPQDLQLILAKFKELAQQKEDLELRTLLGEDTVDVATSVSGESAVGTRPGKTIPEEKLEVGGTEILEPERLIEAVEVSFDALTGAKLSLMQKYKDEGRNLNFPVVRQQLEKEFSTAAVEAEKEALNKLGYSELQLLKSFEAHASNPQVKRAMQKLEMKQQQEFEKSVNSTG